MRKGSLVFVVLMSCPVWAQITSGTIVIFDFTKNQLVVAADSRGVNTDTGVPHDSECKISTFGHHLIFTSVGNARHRKVSGADSEESWDNMEATRTAFRSVRQLPIQDSQMQTIAKTWADAVAANWQSFYHSYPDKVARLVSRTGALTVGAFAEANEGKIYFKAAQIKFDKTPTSLADPITADLEERLGDCWECGRGHKVCALGKHFDIAAKFCAARKPNARITVRTQLKKANQAVKLAVKITELTIDAYNKTPGDVGGMVDAITLKNDGIITWNAIKDNCSQGPN